MSADNGSSVADKPSVNDSLFHEPIFLVLHVAYYSNN